MLIRALLLFLAVVPFAAPVQADWNSVATYFRGNKKEELPSIRILLLHDVKEVNLQIRGKYSLFDPYTNRHISSRFAGKSRTIQAFSDGLRWGEAFPGLYQIKIRPDEPSTSIIIDGHEYKGPIYVYDIGGTVSIVNEIPVEDFIDSALHRYDDQHLELETLAALAIVARTNAYFQASNPKNTYWAVDAQKVGFEGVIPLAYGKTDEAVNLTRHMILSRTGVYEKIATPVPIQFEITPNSSKDAITAKISIEEANAMAKNGEHAAQILGKAFPGYTIMLTNSSK